MKKKPNNTNPFVERAAMDFAYQIVIHQDPRLKDAEYRKNLTNEEKNKLLRKMFQIKDAFTGKGGNTVVIEL